jgi:hypothetical protein
MHECEVRYGQVRRGSQGPWEAEGGLVGCNKNGAEGVGWQAVQACGSGKAHMSHDGAAAAALGGWLGG